MKEKMDRVIGLLDYFVEEVGCDYLSDLPNKEYTHKLKLVLNGIGDDEYTVEQWNEAVCYIFNIEIDFSQVSQAKSYLNSHLF